MMSSKRLEEMRRILATSDRCPPEIRPAVEAVNNALRDAIAEIEDLTEQLRTRPEPRARKFSQRYWARWFR